MKIILKILPWLLILTYIIVALGFAADKRKAVLCTEVEVIIQDSLNRRFYTGQDIRLSLKNWGLILEGAPIYSINTRKIEELFNGKPYIRKVDIYTGVNGSLKVRIRQREPIVRIYTSESRSYYLDYEGNIMPESKSYTPHVLVANGHFPYGDELRNVDNLNRLQDKDRYKRWFEVWELVKKINEDDLWRSQFVQIYLNRQGTFELIPRIGSHVILLGDVSELDEKLNKLKILYLKGFPFEGWNNYEKIDLRYKKQVVCTKRI